MPESNQFLRRQFLQAAAAGTGTALVPWSLLTAGEPAGQPPVKMRSPHRAEVKPHNGRTAITVDGKAIPGMSFYSFGSEKICRDVAETGMPIFFSPSGPFWNGPGKYDFGPFESSSKRLGERLKDVWFIARLNCLGSPP